MKLEHINFCSDYAKKIAKEYYDEKTLEHAIRVVECADTNPVAHISNCSEMDMQLIRDIALLHDILEDTKFEKPSLESLGGDLYKEILWLAVDLLTNKNEPYDEYCERLWIGAFRCEDYSHFKFAYIVKLADIKDHLMQKETLTPRLKEKYLSGLAELL